MTISMMGAGSALSRGPDWLRAPPGFIVDHYATGLPDARSLALGVDGTVYVGTRRSGRVWALRDADGDGRAEARWLLAEGLTMPNGVAVIGDDLFVATMTQVLRLAQIADHLDDPPAPQVVRDDLPAERHHGWRELAAGPQGWLYLSIGAPCNVCDRSGFAHIERFRPDGSGREIVARGVRNSVGLAFDPADGALWFTDNGRDWLGDELPPCELNRLVRPGSHFGFPYCHGAGIRDPDFGGRDCAEFVAPVRELGAHVAPLGLTFYRGKAFPPDFRDGVYLAEHGSWNRSSKVGYRVTRVRPRGARKPVYEAFITGWLAADGAVRGRPVDLLELPDGSLLISDDHAGAIYRVRYAGTG